MKGKKFLTGSPLTYDPAPAPSQQPVLPLCQLEPSIAEIKVAEDALRPRVVVRDGKKQPAPKPYVKPRTPRERCGLSRRDVVALLEKPGVTEALPPWICKTYRALAARNITLDELAQKHGISSIAMEAVVEGWESDIITATCKIYPAFRPRGTESENLPERTENETERVQDSDISKSGGAAIGGRIISRGVNENTGRNKPLDTFERSGRIRGTESAPDTDFSGGDLGEEDNYGENSGDDIFRSE